MLDKSSGFVQSLFNKQHQLVFVLSYKDTKIKHRPGLKKILFVRKGILGDLHAREGRLEAAEVLLETLVGPDKIKLFDNSKHAQ